jgi:hypothetical protein
MLAPTRGVRQPLDLLTKALDTAEALDDLDAYARILEALFLHRSFSADKDKAVSTATKLFQVTDRLGDAARHRNASRLMGGALVMVGKPREAQGFLERYLDADTSTPDQGRLSGSPTEHRAVVRALLAWALWLPGFFDQSRREGQAALDELRSTDHPVLLCRVLFFGMCRMMPITIDFVDRAKHRLPD